MQHESTESSNQVSQSSCPPPSESASQHGTLHSPSNLHHGFHADAGSSSQPIRSVSSGTSTSAQPVDALLLEDKLRRLSVGSGESNSLAQQPTVAGQRILEYEKALTPTSSNSFPIRQSTGYPIIRHAGTPSSGVKLADFPNELLTHIISHLHPDSHGNVALVSKRFYAIVTTPYAWRAAFLRFFPGHESVVSNAKQAAGEVTDEHADRVKSEYRYFTRLTNLATWRSEYLLRTRLLRSIARGKPGVNAGGSASSKPSQSIKKSGAVLTYNSKLPWIITNIHAAFSAVGKRPPRVVHGASEMGVATMSDPSVGRVEKWGYDDPTFFAQLDEMVPDLEPYGVGDGPAASPNVMDVSTVYGLLGGEGFPGGRIYYRATDERRGRYLGQETVSPIIDMTPEIPKIPELTEGISSVWIAKSSTVPSLTQGMVGILTGSSLGVVTAYALGYDSTGARYANGEMTARWVLSPGVPIVSIKVDDNYSQKRKSLGRLWAVAVNALGEVFYLCETPTPPLSRASGDAVVKQAWHTARTVSWELVDATRRVAQPDEFDKNAVRGAYSPRSPSNSMNLSREQIMAEAQEIEKFLRFKPAHFRRVCQGWDMCRRVEVDFTGGDETGAGEAIVVITCGHERGQPLGLVRYTRRQIDDSVRNDSAISSMAEPPASAAPSSLFGNPNSSAVASSIFGGGVDMAKAERSRSHTDTAKAQVSQTATSAPETPPTSGSKLTEEWRVTSLVMKGRPGLEITSSGIDMSTFAVLAPFEDHLVNDQLTASSSPATPVARNTTSEVPGRRARMLAVGTNTGTVLMWNLRETGSGHQIHPVRTIYTDSPSISCLALSALYLVHGGSDGLVQSWDVLASSQEPIRTLSARSSGRVPRNIANANPALRHADYSAVGAVALDPDPTILRGVVAYGTFVRSWTYSSTHLPPGRKRRLRHSDIHGRLASRRHGGAVSSYIAAEAAELRHEQEHRDRQQTRLRNRFGVGFGEMTEEEALQYARIISEEAYVEDEHRRQSASDTGSAADIGDYDSITGSSSANTITPEPSLSGTSPPGRPPSLPPLQEEPDDEFEAQIQRALRLSLLEGVGDSGPSPKDNSSGDFEFQIKTTNKKGKGKRSMSFSPSGSQTHTPVVPYAEAGQGSGDYMLSSSPGANPDADLELALRLSMEEEELRQKQREFEEGNSPMSSYPIHGQDRLDEFPPLDVKGKGKGRMT